MLVVQRKVGERIVLEGGIEITVVATGRGGARLAIRAPKDVWVARGEVHDAIAHANKVAAETAAAMFESQEAARPAGLEQVASAARAEESP